MRTTIAISMAAVLAAASAARAADEPVRNVTPKGNGIMGMKVESVVVQPASITVTTTGAIYVFDRQANRIVCRQRIGNDREVGTVRFDVTAPVGAASFAFERADDTECVLKAGKVTATIRNDSLLAVEGVKTSELIVQCTLKHARARDLFSKARGSWGFDRNVPGHFDGQGGLIAFQDAPAVAVMPPKPFDWQTYGTIWPAELGSTLYGLAGADRIIRENARRGINLFVIWGGTAWQTDMHDAGKPYVPADPEAFKRAIEAVHRERGKVMVYLTSGNLASRGTPETFATRIDELVAAWKIDGVYLDSPSKGWSRRQMFEFLRDLKRKHPALLVFMHEPMDPLAEAYLDAKVIGEFDRDPGQVSFDKIDSRQWSNTPVFWVPDHNIGRSAKAVDTLMESRARMYWGLLPSTDLPGKPAHIRLFEQYYKPLVELEYLAWLEAAGQIQRWQQDHRRNLTARADRFLQTDWSTRERVTAGVEGKATASSQEGAVYYPADYAPGNAVDGSRETCWLAAADRADKHDWTSNHALSVASVSAARMALPWLQIELPAEKTVASVLYDTHWPGQSSNEVWQEAFRIAVSADGKAWTTVAEKKDLTRADRFDLKFTPVACRYVRVDGIKTVCKRVDFWHAAYVTELQVYEQPGAPRGDPRRRPWERR